MIRTKCIRIVYPTTTPSYQVQDSCDNIECKKATYVFLSFSRPDYVSHGAARRTRTHLKKRRGVTPVSNFLVGCTIVVIRLYTAISKEATIMVAMQTMDSAPYVVVLQTSPFCDSSTVKGTS
ncbi:hypothetical protein TNCV_554411 [Trichonephila clavipes]|nr:hypothetical protein TNCV_554411 [Trichonephila clavipes]